MSNSGRFKDMNPGMRPAGKSMPVDKDGVKASLVIADDGRDDHVGKRVAQKFDPKVDSNKAFGKASGLGQGPSAVQSLRPRDRTAFQDVVESRTAPKRPQGTAVDPNNVFGIANKKDGSVQDCMTAPDDADPPLSSSLRIPRNYGPGQQTMRDYGGQFSSDQQFGKPTPNDPSGSLVKGVFSWNGNDKPKATIVPAQAEKQRRGAGRVDPSTTAPLGYAPPADPNSASSLLNYDRQAQTRVARMADLARKARPETMKMGADRMLDLQRAFEEADADGSGKLNKDELANLLEDCGVSLPGDLITRVMRTLDTNGDGEIDYDELLLVLDFTRRMPDEQDLEKKPLHLDSDRAHGMGTIRTDRPAPKNKSLADPTNYGDPTTAGTLITPSAATRSGLDANALEEQRSMTEIRRLFTAMDIRLSDAQFEEAWAVATGENAEDKASVLDFQRALSNLSS